MEYIRRQLHRRFGITRSAVTYNVDGHKCLPHPLASSKYGRIRGLGCSMLVFPTMPRRVLARVLSIQVSNVSSEFIYRFFVRACRLRKCYRSTRWVVQSAIHIRTAKTDCHGGNPKLKITLRLALIAVTVPWRIVSSNWFVTRECTRIHFHWITRSISWLCSLLFVHYLARGASKN